MADVSVKLLLSYSTILLNAPCRPSVLKCIKGYVMLREVMSYIMPACARQELL